MSQPKLNIGEAVIRLRAGIEWKHGVEVTEEDFGARIRVRLTYENGDDALLKEAVKSQWDSEAGIRSLLDVVNHATPHPDRDK